MKTRRLPGYDYSQPAGYFVTISSWKRKEIFSSITDQNIILSEPGRIIQSCWTELPKHFETIELGNFSIMPNHLHGIIIIQFQMNEKELSKLSEYISINPHDWDEKYLHSFLKKDVI